MYETLPSAIARYNDLAAQVTTLTAMIQAVQGGTTAMVTVDAPGSKTVILPGSLVEGALTQELSAVFTVAASLKARLDQAAADIGDPQA